MNLLDPEVDIEFRIGSMLKVKFAVVLDHQSIWLARNAVHLVYRHDRMAELASDDFRLGQQLLEMILEETGANLVLPIVNAFDGAGIVEALGQQTKQCVRYAGDIAIGGHDVIDVLMNVIQRLNDELIHLEEIRRDQYGHGDAGIEFGHVRRRVSIDEGHQPLKDVHVTMNTDVHLFELVVLVLEIIGEVAHLTYQQRSLARELTLQILRFVTDGDTDEQQFTFSLVRHVFVSVLLCSSIVFRCRRTAILEVGVQILQGRESIS